MVRSAVEHRLAACVQVALIGSTYRWRGAVEEAEEYRLTFKTTMSRYRDLEQHIRQAHTYEMPEIIAVPIVAGSPEYLRWIESETA